MNKSHEYDIEPNQKKKSFCTIYVYIKLKIIYDVRMQVVVIFREEGEVMAGWGQEGNLYRGDVHFLFWRWLVLWVCSP